MPKKKLLIKGSKINSVWVGQTWTEITIAIPTETVVRRGGEISPKRPASASRAAKKAAITKRAKKKAAAAAAAAGKGN